MVEVKTPRDVHIAPFGHLSVSAVQQAAFFCTKVVSPSLWTRDALRHLQAGKCLNCNPARVGCNCGAGRILVNASASFHHRRGCLGVLALSGRFVHGTLAGWAQKVAKNSAGHVPRSHCFLATERQGCSEVLLCSARGRPSASACADAWRDRSRASHNANGTDVANSLAYATKNHPTKSAS